ncbi:MAG TPA: PP0621 family protein [Burkholderiaceae bacterium]
MKLVFWLVLIAIVVMALRSKARAAVRNAQAQAEAQQRPAPRHAEALTMVSCAQCGLYVPAPEAIQADGIDFCCEQHRRQYGA